MSLRAEWERCWPFLKPALDLDPTDSPEGIYQAVVNGEWDFWPGERTAAIGQVVQHELRRDYHLWLAGGDIEEAKRAYQSIRAYAKALGCNRVTVFGRRGFIRALGMRETFVGMAEDL